MARIERGTHHAAATCTFSFGIKGIGFRVWGSGFQVQAFRSGVWGVGFEVWILEFGVLGLHFVVLGCGFGVWDSSWFGV